MIEYLGIAHDNNIRSDTTLDKLAALKPSFDFSGAGTLTAGNSTPMTDGAAAVFWPPRRGLASAICRYWPT